MVTKEELLQKFVVKEVTKNKMITEAGQMFFDDGKELDKSDKIIKGYEDYIGDYKIRNYISEKICGDKKKKFVLRR